MNGGGATTLGVLLGVRFTFQCAISSVYFFTICTFFMNLLEMLLYLFK